MKANMKSAFAIIAVALMVMVAIVPMASLFANDASADVFTTVPAVDYENGVILTVTVNDASGAPVADDAGVYVKVAYGSYKWVEPTDDGVAAFALMEASISKLTITVVDADGVADANYTAVNLDNLLADHEYTATLTAGKVKQKATFAFENGVDIADVLAFGAKISAKYEVYETAESTKAVATGNFVFDDDFTATFEYPLKDYEGDKIFVTVKDFNAAGIKLTFVAKEEVSTDGVAEFEGKETLVTINPGATVIAPVTIDKLTANYTEGTKDKTITFTAIANELLYGEEVGLLYADLTPATSLEPVPEITYKIQTKAGGASSELVAIDIAGETGTYSPAGAIFGTIKLGEIAQSGKIALDVCDPDDNTKKTAVTVDVDAEGTFFKFVKVGAGYTVIKNIKFTSNSVTYDATTENAYSGDAAVAIAITNPGYSLVAGKLTLVGSEVPVELKTLKITSGVKTFGSLITGLDGTFGFLAEDGKNITFTVDGATLSGDVNVVPGQASDELEIMMSTQEVSVKIQDAAGKKIESADASAKLYYDALCLSPVSFLVGDAMAWDATAKAYKGVIRGDLDATKLYVEPAMEGYTFDAGLYAKDKAFKANEADYTFAFYDANGEILALGADAARVYFLDVYKNSAGVFIYEDEILVDEVEVAAGVFTIKGMPSEYAYLSAADVKTTPTLVVIVVPQEAATNVGIFDELYIYGADSEGTMKITSAVDSLEGKLTRNDKATPLVGAKVTMGDSVTYTKADGSFKLTSPTKITAATKVFFVLDGYVFNGEGYAAVKNGVKVTSYVPDGDTYTVSFKDADGKACVPADIVATYDGNAVDLAAATHKWEVGKDIAVTSTNRTFVKYTLTADDVAKGKVVIPTEQKTYTVKAVDGTGAKIAGAALEVKAQFDGVAFDAVPAGIPVAISGVTSAQGTATFLVTDLTNKILADAGVTGYGVKLTKEGEAFPTSFTLVTGETTTLTSSKAAISYTVVDAAGKALSAGAIYAAGNVSIFKEDGSAYAPEDKAFANGRITFTGSSTENYKVTIGPIMDAEAVADATFQYTFAAKQAPVNGKLYANEEWSYAYVVDAAGKWIGVADETSVKANYDSGSTIEYFCADAAAGEFVKILVDLDKVVTYEVVNAPANYTFEKSSVSVIKANESDLAFSAVTANGVLLPDAVITVAKAYNANGEIIANGVDGVIVDVDKVLYYTANVVYVEGDFELTFAESSLDGVFVANESLITGSIPRSDLDQNVSIQLIKGGAVIESYDAIIDVEKGKYKAYVDLSGQVVGAAAFDSISAAYYEGGILVSTTPVSASSTSPIIVTPAPNPVLLGSDLILEHYTATVVGRQIVLAADQTFDVVIGTTQVEGKQLVNKYTFAGWYVNGVMVSDSANFVVPAEGTTAVYADYSVETVEVEAPSPAANNGVDPTVLIIGICAVIIALIAVAYVVITSRKNNN